MTIYDGIMAAVLIVGMARGAWRGITWQLASLGSLVLGYLFSYPISALIAPRLPGTPEAARAMSMALAYVAVSSAVFGAAWMVRGVIRKMKFDAFDRHLGMMLGGLEGVAVGILGTMLVTSVAPTTRGPIFASTTGQVVTAVVGFVGPILPGEVRTALAPYWQGGSSASAPVVAEAEAEVGSDYLEPAQAPVPIPLPLSAPAADAPLALPTPARLDRAIGKAATTANAVAPRSAPATALTPGTAAVPAAAADPTAEATPPSARQVMDSLVERGRRTAEQALTESLDTDPDGKAATIRDLIEKDKGRLRDAVLGTVDQTKRELTDQVKNRAGNLQGQAGDAQKRMEEYRARVAQAQQGINRARQQLEQGADGVVNDGRKKLEKSLSDAIDKGLDKLGLPDSPAPARAPAAAPK